MKPRVLLDTNVFIYAHEFPESNSARVIELLNRGQIEGIITERVLKEVQHYFRQYYERDQAGLVRYYLLVSCVAGGGVGWPAIEGRSRRRTLSNWRRCGSWG